jgi:hypothetical protein
VSFLLPLLCPLGYADGIRRDVELQNTAAPGTLVSL